MKSASQHVFAQLPSVHIPRASFQRNSRYTTTFDAGKLVPVYLEEVLPGDTFNLSLTSFARILSPLKYPIMDNLYMDFQFFFVPVRLVYSDYEKFFGSSKGREGKWEYDDSHLMPGITSPTETGFEVGSLADYFGIPTGVPNLRVNALPFRAYNLIIGDWYRPSSYPWTPLTVNLGNDDDDPSIYSVVPRVKRCDYFTASLTEPQRGPGVELSLGATAPVVGNGMGLGFMSYKNDGTILNTVIGTNSSGAVTWKTSPNSNFGSASTSNLGDNVSDSQLYGVSTDANLSGLIADLSSTTAITINSLRQAYQLQVALEKDERGGVAYVDQLMSHFGVRSPDARLQRSEYLGGGSTPIQIHAVTNTAGTTDRDQGSLAAYGVSGQDSVGFVKSFVEHGYIIGIASVRADLTYQQGLPKLFDRFARFDFYYPVMANLGEQVVKNKEIYAQGADVKDDDGNVIDEQVFGYQERFAEYRYGASKITGQLRSTFAQSLDVWHLSQKFNNLPTLGEDFLFEDVPMSRVKAVTDGPDFLFDSLIRLNCVRPMPLYGVPGFGKSF